jgi:hypothetical protein
MKIILKKLIISSALFGKNRLEFLTILSKPSRINRQELIPDGFLLVLDGLKPSKSTVIFVVVQI